MQTSRNWRHRTVLTGKLDIREIHGTDALTKKMGINRFSPFNVALFVHDLIAVIFAFAFGAWITALSPFSCFFILSFTVIAFFATYDLYNYHLIFLTRNHLLNLTKSFGWGLLTLSIIAFLYPYPDFLDGNYVMPLIFSAAIGVLVLSRFFWDHLLNLLKSVGMGFLVVGIVGLVSEGENPIILEHWPAIFLGFFQAVGTLTVSRSLLVHVVFNDWLRRHFRRQVAIIGSDQEAKRIASHIVDLNAPFWVAGFVSDQDFSNLEMPVNKDRLGELKELLLIVE